MIFLEDIKLEDLELLNRWVAADPWHKDEYCWQYTNGMLTGNGLLSFKVCDDIGPVVYVRLNEDKDLVRIAMQFGPEEEVSKRRLIVAMIDGAIPAMVNFARNKGYKGLVFESVSPALIRFGKRAGFKSVGKDDYVLTFEDKLCA